MEKFKTHNTCRVCGGELHEVMDYGFMPLANALADTYEEAIDSELFEQRLLFCKACLLGQLSIVVDPEILYKGYVYRSSTSEEFKAHCRSLARDLWRYRPGKVIDIAGNDGALMREILAENSTAIGFVVDPSQDGTKAHYAKIMRFWNEETAQFFLSEYGRAEIITAQNVVGHVDDVHEFFRGVSAVLSDEGVFVVEVPSFVRLVAGLAFDTVYHEHLSYWTVTALNALATATGFYIARVEEKEIHCGTLRVWLRKGDGPVAPVNSLRNHLAAEALFFSGSVLEDFREAVSDRVSNLCDMLDFVYRYNEPGALPTPACVGVTAGAKTSVFLNYVKVGPRLRHLVDNNPEKHWKFLPGAGLQILPFLPGCVEEHALAVILSRNWRTPLLKQLDDLGFSGLVLTV